MPKISVIVPVYNSVKCLPRCLQSLQSQTLQDIEVILVDDGSTDGSGEICDIAARLDGRMKTRHQVNRGPTCARQMGLRMATADYVTFVDADDWVEPELCELFYENAMTRSADIIIGAHLAEMDGCAKLQQSCLKPGYYDRERLEHDIFPVLFHNDFHDEWSVWPYLWGKCFYRHLVLTWQETVDAGIWLGEDACVTFPCIVHARSLVLLQSPLYHYVQRVDSQFRTKPTGDDLLYVKRIYQLVESSFNGQMHENSLREQLRTYILTTILLPRSPLLLSGLEREEDIFPFRNTRRGSRVIIYGAGIFGMALHDFLMRTHQAEVVLWLDARAGVLREHGLDVISLSEAYILPEHDYILVPIMKITTTAAIVRDLVAFGAMEEKIRCIDEAYVMSEFVWQRFGIIESQDFA